MFYARNLLTFSLFFLGLQTSRAAPVCKGEAQRIFRSGFAPNRTSKTVVFVVSGGIVLGLGVYNLLAWQNTSADLPASEAWTSDPQGNPVPVFSNRVQLSLVPFVLGTRYRIHNDKESWGEIVVERSEVTGGLVFEFYKSAADSGQSSQVVAKANWVESKRPGEIRRFEIWGPKGEFLGSHFHADFASVQTQKLRFDPVAISTEFNDPRVAVLVQVLGVYLGQVQDVMTWSLMPR